MTSKTMIQSHPGEIASAIRRHRFERTESGIYLTDSRVFVGGALRVRDFKDFEELHAIDANTLLTQGLTHAANSLFVPTGGYAQITAWYVAPYSGDYTPDAGLTAATFKDTATEFIAYTATTRLALVFPAAATTPVASSNEVQMTFNASGGPFDVYGAALLSASAKSATTGKGFAAIRMDNPRLGMANSDKLGFQYVFTATDAG